MCGQLNPAHFVPLSYSLDMILPCPAYSSRLQLLLLFCSSLINGTLHCGLHLLLICYPHLFTTSSLRPTSCLSYLLYPPTSLTCVCSMGIVGHMYLIQFLMQLTLIRLYSASSMSFQALKHLLFAYICTNICCSLLTNIARQSAL